MSVRFGYVALLSLLAGFSVTAAAQDKPLWEFGLGAGFLHVPDYRGSAYSATYVAPIPYLIYRGRLLQVDREGLHGDIFKTERVKLDWSAAAGIPSKSRDDGPRAGMPDLDATVEAGPSLEILLHRDETNQREWSLRLPLRAVAATDLRHTKGAGWVFAPSLHLDMKRIGAGWEGSLAFGPMYATEAYHDYYYEVVPGFVTATRPAYDAKGGYSGSRMTAILSRRFDGFWVGGFARYDTLSGASFADSPLVKKKESFMIGIGMAWVYSESSRRVPAR